MWNAFARSLLWLAVIPNASFASSPTPVDLALHMRVIAPEPERLAPGTSGLIEFSVENRWTRDFQVAISSYLTPVASDTTQPFRLFTPGDAVGACEIQQTTASGPMGSSDIVWFILGPTVGPDGVYTCSAGFEVLPAATGQQSLTFRAGVFSANTTVIHHDVTPWNNFAYLRYGVSATPVPAGTPLTWLALALLLSCTAASQRHRLRPGPF